jgi:type II secretory pathway component PulL
MFVIGGILYAIGNLLTGQMKQSAHGWAQGLIIGGIIAIILIILAEPIVNMIATAGQLPTVSCGHG